MEDTLTTTLPPPSQPAPATIVEASAGATKPYRWRWLVLVAVMCGEVMDMLDGSIVNVAGPSIRRDLGGGVATLQWLSAGYTLAFAVCLITGARLGDIFGRRRLFLIGAGGFGLASVACASAPSPELLIAARVLQGGLGALMIPQGLGMLRETFPENEMSKVFGFFGPAMAFPAIAAPVVAGGLISANLFGTGWRLVFLINLPAAIAAVVLAVRFAPKTVAQPSVKLDIGGMALVGGAFAAIIYPIIQGRAAGWPAWIFALLAAGVALLGAFALYERRRTRDPLIERSLLSNQTYLCGIAVALALFGGFGGIELCVGLFCQVGEGFSPIHASLTLIPVVVGMVVGMVGSFPLAEKLGRYILHIGIATIILGAVILALTLTGTHTASTWGLVPGLFVVGAGAGASFGKLFDFILTGVAMNEIGSASGVLSAVEQLSTSLGVAALGTIFFSVLETHLPTDALQITAWGCLVPLLIAFGLVFLLPMTAREEND